MLSAEGAWVFLGQQSFPADPRREVARRSGFTHRNRSLSCANCTHSWQCSTGSPLPLLPASCVQIWCRTVSALRLLLLLWCTQLWASIIESAVLRRHRFVVIFLASFCFRKCFSKAIFSSCAKCSLTSTSCGFSLEGSLCPQAADAVVASLRSSGRCEWKESAGENKSLLILSYRNSGPRSVFTCFQNL